MLRSRTVAFHERVQDQNDKIMSCFFIKSIIIKYLMKRLRLSTAKNLYSHGSLALIINKIFNLSI